MPNPNNRVTKQQWQSCDRCGFLYPIGSLTKQKGLMLDRKCLDNLEVERRPRMIEKVLTSGVDQEGVDTRGYDRGFFDGWDEEAS